MQHYLTLQIPEMQFEGPRMAGRSTPCRRMPGCTTGRLHTGWQLSASQHCNAQVLRTTEPSPSSPAVQSSTSLRQICDNFRTWHAMHAGGRAAEAGARRHQRHPVNGAQECRRHPGAGILCQWRRASVNALELKCALHSQCSAAPAVNGI